MNWNKKIESGLKTPEKFFENFEKNILEKINAEKPIIKINFWEKNKKWILSSAALLLFSFGILFFNNLNENVITSDTIVYEDILHLTDWENELTDEEITQLNTEILFEENNLDEENYYIEYTEIN